MTYLSYLIQYYNVSIIFFLVPGEWSSWQDSKCSVSCGDGQITRVRECNNPIPSNGGDACPGSATDIIDCNLKNCPGLSMGL